MPGRKRQIRKGLKNCWRDARQVRIGREAYFVCAIALAESGRGMAIVADRVDGEILEAPRGSGGFGYDPVFYFPALEKTFAELPPEEKNQRSHRGRLSADCSRLFPPCYSLGSYGDEIEEKTIVEEETRSGKNESSEIPEERQDWQAGSCDGNGPKRVAAILAKLDEAYGNATCELKHENAFQLLISTILSAQCTTCA